MAERFKRQGKLVMAAPREVRTALMKRRRRLMRSIALFSLGAALGSIVVAAFRATKSPEKIVGPMDVRDVVHEPIPAETMEPKRSAEDLFSASVNAYKEHDFGRAKELAELARECCEDDTLRPKICNLLGIIHHESGRHSQAVAEFLAAIRHDQSNAGYYYNWAEAMRAEGHPDAAIAPMRKAAQLRQNDPLIRIKLNFLLIECGQAETIAGRVNQLSGKGSINIEWAFVKAALLRLTGQENESRELLEKLKKVAPAELYGLCLADPVFQKEPRTAAEKQNISEASH